MNGETLYFVLGLQILFWSVLWMIGTRDRQRIIRFLRAVLSHFNEELAEEQKTREKSAIRSGKKSDETEERR